VVAIFAIVLAATQTVLHAIKKKPRTNKEMNKQSAMRQTMKMGNCKIRSGKIK